MGSFLLSSTRYIDNQGPNNAFAFLLIFLLNIPSFTGYPVTDSGPVDFRIISLFRERKSYRSLSLFPITSRMEPDIR